MVKYDINEALCHASQGEIVMRRRSLFTPLAIFLFGVVLFVINGFIDGNANMDDLKSAIVLFGAVFILAGGAMALIRLSGGGMAPWHSKEEAFLKKEELKFAKEDKNRVVNLVEQQDFSTLRQLKQANVSAVTVMLWTSPAGKFTAAQVFEYEELELQPISELVVKA